MNHYWYFTFHITDPLSGYNKTDRAVTCSADGAFPIVLVQTWAEEEFGESVFLRVESQVEISQEDYDRLAEEIGVD